MHKPVYRDFLFIVGAALSWGTVGVANQMLYASSTTNALSLAFLRLAIAAPLFLLACWFFADHHIWRIKKRDLGLMLLMGGLQGLYQTSYSAAIPAAGVTISTLIALCVAPIMVALVSTLLLRERLTRMILLALAMALGGTALLVTASPHTDTGNNSLPGIIFALLAAAGYAGFILCGQRLTSNYHPLQVNAIAFGSGALLLFLVSPSMNLAVAYPLEGWLLLLYLGCIPTALAYALFQIGMRSLSATVVSIVTLCEPFMAALLAWLLFQEQLALSGLLGAGLLLAAMGIILFFYKSS